jgi:hypothetical protein
VEDDERGGRPKSTRTEVNLAAVADLVKNDRRIASRMIAQNVPLATEPGISLIILPLMRILQRNLKRTYLIV